MKTTKFPIFHYTKFFLNAPLWNGGSALDYAPRALAFASKYWLETKRIVFLFFLWRNFIVLLTITREKKAALCLSLLFLQLRHTCGAWITSAMINVDEKIIHSQPLNQKYSRLRCFLFVKGLEILDTFSSWVLLCHKNPKSVQFYILIKKSVCNLSRFFEKSIYRLPSQKISYQTPSLVRETKQNFSGPSNGTM